MNSRATVRATAFSVRSPSPRLRLALAMLLCAGAFIAAGPAIAGPRPNIIVIMADDLGWGDIGVHGQADIQTPRIDAMAAQGMRFTQMYSGSTVCSPSRAVAMTGMHVGHVDPDRNWTPNTPLRPEDTTVAQIAKAAGYDTYFYGKWGLGGAWPAPDWAIYQGANATGLLDAGAAHNLPVNKGFDHSYAYLDQLTAHIYYTEYLWRGAQPNHGHSNAGNAQDFTVKEPIVGNWGVPGFDPPLNGSFFGPGDRTVYSHDLFTEDALDVLENADGSAPIFMQLWFTLVHRETWPPPVQHPDGAPAEQYTGEAWLDVDKAFAAMTTYLDYDVGRILDAIDANPALAGNTLVIFTSDNGPQQTDGHLASVFASSGPFRGIKRDLYEGGVRVPFIARWPGTITGGTTSDHIGGFQDFLPTVAELAGTKSPSGIDGVSIAPTLTGQGAQGDHAHLFWEFHEGGAADEQRFAVRDGDWKFILRQNGASELYDLGLDEGEATDVALAHPSVVSDMLQIVNAEATGPPAVVPPLLELEGDVAFAGNSFALDFGLVSSASAPVASVFRARNGAQAYSNLMNGEVDAAALTDPRLAVDAGEYIYLVDGASSRDFTVTLTPSGLGPLAAQELTVTGFADWYGSAATNAPAALAIAGEVIHPPSSWSFSGSAAGGGSVRVQIAGVAFAVPTSPAQSGADLAAALAAAVAANVELQGLGVSALASGGTLTATGSLDQVVVMDAGVAVAATSNPVPLTGGTAGALTLAAALIAAAGVVVSRGRSGRRDVARLFATHT